jgi:hypothetical protein
VIITYLNFSLKLDILIVTHFPCYDANDCIQFNSTNSVNSNRLYCYGFKTVVSVIYNCVKHILKKSVMT